MRHFIFFMLSLAVFVSEESALLSQEAQSVEDRAKTPILTPSLSQRQTSKLKLSNGLEAYLISDPQATQSGAVLTVQAGSWDDPEDYPGLAHFLEHMLFLGTEKYPQESDYDRFIRAHNGKSNAYTASDHTLYLFSINNDAFEEALDRFASFFKQPLFNPSGVARELQAIDQEFAKNLIRDEIRENAVQKELGNSQHPYHRFSAGNTLTLSQASQSVLKQWYRDHYSANIMRLIVYSPLSLDALKQLVIQDFSGIPNRHLQPLQTTIPVLAKQHEATITYIDSIKNIRALRLTWELPLNFDEDDLYKPETVLCYVLGHEGSGSLLAALKDENFAENLSCAGYRLGSQHLLFSLYINLTGEGLRNVEKVIERCFEAIANFRREKFPAFIFDEVKKIATMRYQYQSQEDPFHYLMKMGGWLIHENLETFPEHTLIPQVFNPQLIHTFLSYLTPQRAHIHILAKSENFAFPLTQKERWMGVAYDTRRLSTEQIERWSQVSTQPRIYLPEPNPFIPQHLNVSTAKKLEKDKEIGQEQRAIPRPDMLMDNEEAKLYFAKDTHFQVPQTIWFFEIQTPAIEKGVPSKSILTDFYVKCLQEALKPFSYPAQLADLEYEIEEVGKGILLTIKGYSDNAEILFDAILQRLKTCLPSEQLFHTFKQSLIREYQNLDQESALQQGIEIFQSILYQNYSTYQQKFAAIQTISYEDLKNYLKHVYDQTYVRGLLYGNIEREQALRLWNKLQAALNSRLFPKEQRPVERILVLPSQQGPYFLEITTSLPAHAAVLGIEDALFSFKTRAAQQILSQAMGSAFYSTLRTQQQTGYLVYNSAEELDKHLFSFFAVQSYTHDSRDLLARFELFIENFLQEMTKTELQEERFEMIRQAILTTMKQPPQNLIEMGELLKTLAFKYEGDFDWIAKRIQGLKELTYEDFLEISVQFLGKQNKRRLAILVKGTIPDSKSFQYVPLKTVQAIRQLSQYTHLDE